MLVAAQGRGGPPLWACRTGGVYSLQGRRPREDGGHSMLSGAGGGRSHAEPVDLGPRGAHRASCSAGRAGRPVSVEQLVLGVGGGRSRPGATQSYLSGSGTTSGARPVLANGGELRAGGRPVGGGHAASAPWSRRPGRSPTTTTPRPYGATRAVARHTVHRSGVRVADGRDRAGAERWSATLTTSICGFAETARGAAVRTGRRRG